MTKAYRWQVFIFCMLLPFHGSAGLFPDAVGNYKTVFTENKGQWHHSILYRAQIPGGYFYLTPQGFVYVFEDYDKLHALTHGHAEDTLLPMHVVKVCWKNATVVKSQIQTSSKTVLLENYLIGTVQVRHVASYDTLIIKNIYTGMDMVLYGTASGIKYDLVVASGSNLRNLALEYYGTQSLGLQHGTLHWKHALGTVYESKPKGFIQDVAKNSSKTVSVNYQLKDHTLRFETSAAPKKNERLVIDPEIVFSSYVGAKADNFGYTATYDKQGNCYTAGVVFNYLPLNPFETRFPVDSFPVSPGAFQTTFQGGYTDIVVFVFGPDGKERKYATYFGGNKSETPHSIIVNSKNQLLIYGATSSTNLFATLSNGFDLTFNGPPTPVGYVTYTNQILFSGFADAFVAMLSPNGDSLLAGTYFGGQLNDGIDSRLATGPLKNYFFLGDEFRGEILVDANDYVYIAGTTESSDLPIVNSGFNAALQGNQDGFLAKFTPMLTQLQFSTYIGGMGEEAISSLELDRHGNIFVSGITNSSVFLTTTTGIRTAALGGLDGFVARFSPEGRLLNHAFLGTNQDDKAVFVRRDRAGAIYVLGNTWGNYTITTNSGIIYSDPNSGQFIHKLSNDLRQTIFSTTFGSGSGKPDMAVNAFVVNACGIPMISGWLGDLKRIDFEEPVAFMPTTPNALVGNAPDGKNKGFYFCSFTPNMRSLDYATFLGSGSYDHVDGGTSRFDEDGIIYQAICAGCRGNSNTPAYPIGGTVWSSVNRSQNCNIMGVKFDFQYKPLRVSIQSEPEAVLGTVSGVAPLDVDFFNQSNKTTSGTSFSWRLITALDDELASKSTAAYRPEPFDEMDIYRIQLIGLDSSCNSTDNTILFRDTAVVVVLVRPTVTGNNICEGSTGIITPVGGAQYTWLPPTTGLALNSTGTRATVTGILDSTTYRVVARSRNFAFNGYLDTMHVAVKTIRLRPRAAFAIQPDTLGYLPFTARFIDISTITGLTSSAIWRLHNGLSGVGTTTSFTYTQIGRYPVQMVLQDRRADCVALDTITRYVTALPKVESITFCKGSIGVLQAAQSPAYVWYDATRNILSREATATITAPGIYFVDVFDTQGNAYTIPTEASHYPSIELKIYQQITLLTPMQNSIELTAEPALNNNMVWTFPNGSTHSGPSVSWSVPQGQPQTITLTGIDTNGCTVTAISLIEPKQLIIPNIFTPNGDGVNDAFFIPGALPGTMKLTVFNRWGRKVFESKGYDYVNQWNAADEPDGVYFFTLQFLSEEKPYKGWVQVLR